MSVTMKQALEEKIISDRIISMIPKKCRCGSDLEFSDSMRILKCSNKDCVYKTINRMHAINNKLQIGLNDSTLEEIVTNFQFKTPYQILLLDQLIKNNNTNLIINDEETIIQNIKKAKQNDLYLYEIVEMCGIKTVENVAYKLFNGFNSIDEVYKQIDKAQISFVCERLGIKDSDSVLIAFDIYEKLIGLKDELIFAEAIFNIKQYNNNRLTIAFSDNVIPFYNVSEVIDYLRVEFNRDFTLVTAIDDATDILIRNSIGTSNKMQVADNENNKYTAKLMNSGKLSLSDIGKFTDGQLKPNGHTIYIDTLDNVIERLKSIKE